MTIQEDIQKLSPGAIIELYEIDLTTLGDTKYYLHAGTNELKNNVVWQGNTYIAFPIEVTGFELKSNGALPRPILKIANITGLISTLIKSFDDLIGAKVIRKRTLVKYIDAVNFESGNPSADPNVFFPDDIYFINKKNAENKIFVELELSSSLDLHGIKLPRRQVIQNTCVWGYKSANCSYAGGPVADINDDPTSDPDLDACGKRLVSCKFRFGENNQLPYGGFPGSGLIS